MATPAPPVTPRTAAPLLVTTPTPPELWEEDRQRDRERIALIIIETRLYQEKSDEGLGPEFATFVVAMTSSMVVITTTAIAVLV
ncbi:hypothetical protein GGR51DRAFT_565284 [Nemania sp. FL0031]|nr:hypothetical protein GGR51DRAFT_565284 [Nemania sp. FL0031]